MAGQKSVYVSIVPGVYRASKADVLAAQASLLRIMKSMQNLKILARRRKDLRNQLIKLMEQTVKLVHQTENKFPEPDIPSKYLRKKSKSSKKSKADKLDLKIKRDYSKKAEIDAELFEIQKKLNALQ